LNRCREAKPACRAIGGLDEREPVGPREPERRGGGYSEGTR
jgi:hypothetical protein